MTLETSRVSAVVHRPSVPRPLLSLPLLLWLPLLSLPRLLRTRRSPEVAPELESPEPALVSPVCPSSDDTGGGRGYWLSSTLVEA